MRARRGEGGFTYVELLAMVLLLGVLVLIMLPNYFGGQVNARREVDRANVRTINVALALYRARTGACPAGADAFEAFLDNTAYFPHGRPLDPWTNPLSAAPYIHTYSAALCVVQMSVSAPRAINHATGLGH